MTVPDVISTAIDDIDSSGYEFVYLQYNTPVTWYEALEGCPTWNPTGRLATIGVKSTFTDLQTLL